MTKEEKRKLDKKNEEKIIFHILLYTESKEKKRGKSKPKKRKSAEEKRKSHMPDDRTLTGVQ